MWIMIHELLLFRMIGSTHLYSAKAAAQANKPMQRDKINAESREIDWL